MNLFKYLFGHKMSPFDQLVEMFGGDGRVRVWNGTTYGPEVMFRQGCDPDSSTGSGPYYTFDSPPPIVKISVGRCNYSYDDFLGRTCDSVFDIYVHQNTCVTCRDKLIRGRWDDEHLVRKAHKLLSKIPIGYPLETENVLLRKWLGVFFNARPESRCLSCVTVDGLKESSIRYLENELEELENKYKLKLAAGIDVQKNLEERAKIMEAVSR